MLIEELKEGEVVRNGDSQNQNDCCGVVTACKSDVVAVWDAKRVLVGAGARALFYPTLLYNVVRNRFQSEFRWWDQVDKCVLLGAVPFPTDVPRLKELGVSGVVTLNEPYETLVPSSMYHAHGIKHLVIPTRDYLFAPTIGDICQAVDFIHENASIGKTTYVHCKAGRGRSTTIVLCYLVQHRLMTPESAYEYIRSIRPRVLLASAQWQAVKEFYHSYLERNEKHSSMVVKKTPSRSPSKRDMSAFDDGSVVLVTESDLAGYESGNTSCDGSGVARKNDILPQLSLACKVQFASQAAFARISCFWLKTSGKKQLSRPVPVDQLQSLSVNIRVH